MITAVFQRNPTLQAGGHRFESRTAHLPKRLRNARLGVILGRYSFLQNPEHRPVTIVILVGHLISTLLTIVVVAASAAVRIIDGNSSEIECRVQRSTTCELRWADRLRAQLPDKILTASQNRLLDTPPSTTEDDR